MAVLTEAIEAGEEAEAGTVLAAIVPVKTTAPAATSTAEVDVRALARDPPAMNAIIAQTAGNVRTIGAPLDVTGMLVAGPLVAEALANPRSLTKTSGINGQSSCNSLPPG